MAVIPRHAAAGRSGSSGQPSSVAEIGRLLRRTRTRQGLRLEEVAVRTGLPVSQLEALETGAVAQMPDQVVIVKVLRRYGEALGLPGDRLALALIDLWPSSAPAETQVAAPPAAVLGSWGRGQGGGLPVPETQAVLVGPPTGSGLSAGLDTASVPRIFVEDDPTMSNPTGPPPISGAFVDTGVTSAVGRPKRTSSGRHRTALALRVLVGVVAVAVVIGLAGLITYAIKPSWFHSLGIGRGSSAAPAPPPSTAPSGRGGSGRSNPAPAPFTVTSTGNDSATVSIRTLSPTVRISAVGGDCWVEVTTPGQSTTLFAAVLNAGAQQSFPIGRSLTVVLGSGAGKTTLLQGTKVLGAYAPPNAPFTVTFTTSAAPPVFGG